MIKAKTYEAAKHFEAPEPDEEEIRRTIERLELEQLRDELAMRAPSAPIWFQPAIALDDVIDYEERARRLNLARLALWPWAYADAVIAARGKGGEE